MKKHNSMIQSGQGHAKTVNKETQLTKKKETMARI